MRFELGAVRHVNGMCGYIINSRPFVVTCCDLTGAQTTIVGSSVSKSDRRRLAEKLLENRDNNRRFSRGRIRSGLVSMPAITRSALLAHLVRLVHLALSSGLMH